MARPGQRQTGARRTAPRQPATRPPPATTSPRCSPATVREVEAAAQRGRVTPAVRTKFQAVALLLREERARVRAADGSDSQRAEQLKRLDGIATILATIAVRDAGLLALLAEDAVVSDAARALARDLLRGRRRRAAGRGGAAGRGRGPTAAARAPRRAAVGDLPAAGQPLPRPRLLRAPRRVRPRPRRLAGWELLGPLLSSFERAGGGAAGVHGRCPRRPRGSRPAAWS